MEKKTECEIVQDLLLGYVDGILNSESKKLVEQHLLKCSNCQKRLQEIQEDIKENENNQKKEIDYLKKIRRRSKIKSIIFLIIAIILIFLCIYLYKFFILNSISVKVSKKFQTDNFYIETISNAGFEGDGIFIDETWYKDGKFKTKNYIKTENDEISQDFGTMYGKIGENEVYYLNENNKTATKEYFPFERKKETLVTFPNPIFPSSMNKYMLFRLGAPFFTKISHDNKEIGREYYKLQLGENELWVDMDTGLPLMSFGYSSQTEYYNDTKIPKRSSKGICQYKYEFEVVTDEMVEMPDISEYKIEEINMFE